MAEYTSFRVGVDPNVEGGNILYISGWVKEIYIDGTLQYSNSRGDYIRNNYTVSDGQEIRIRGRFRLGDINGYSTISRIDNFILQNTMDFVNDNPNFTGNPVELDVMFWKCKNLTSIAFNDNIDTSNVTNMYQMFRDCESLTTITNLEKLDTSNVIGMLGMFWNCKSLTSLNVSNFNTSNVTSMGAMFYVCSSLTSLDVSNFDTSNVTDMVLMFASCNNLETINLSSFNLTNTTDMEQMFNGCEKLTSIPQQFVDKFNAYPDSIGKGCYINCDSLVNIGDNTNLVYNDIPVYWRTKNGEEPEEPENPEPTTYNITYSLTNCNYNGQTGEIIISVNAGDGHTATIYPNDGYDKVTIMKIGSEVDIGLEVVENSDGSITFNFTSLGADVFIGLHGKIIYTVIYNLTDCYSTNTNGQIEYDPTLPTIPSYSTIIYPNSNYTLDTIRVEMGGEEFSNYVFGDNFVNIDISEVTGDIIITATAKQSGIGPGPNPTGSPTGSPTGPTGSPTGPTGSPTGPNPPGPTGSPTGPTGEHNCDPENCKCILVGKNYTTTITVGHLKAGTEIKATDKIQDILERILTGIITPSFQNPTLLAVLNETVNTTINTDVLFTVDISIVLNDAEGPYNIKATVNGKEVYNNDYTEGQTFLNCALLAKDNTSIGNFPVKVTLTYYRYGIETSITVETSNKINIENDGSIPEFLIGKCNNYGAKYPSQFTAAKMNEMISAGNLEWTTNLYSGKEYTLGNMWDIIAFVPVSYLTSQNKNEVDELLRFMGWDDLVNNYVEVYPDNTEYCRGNATLLDRFGRQIEFRYCAYKSRGSSGCNYKMVRR